nr:hypothetical protein [Tanacetum cinerariifolium]
EMGEPLGAEVEDDKDEEEDPDEEPEEKEMEDEEIEDEEMVNNKDDGGNEEDDVEIGGNFHIGESSDIRDLLAGNSKVYAPGLLWCDLESVHKRVKRIMPPRKMTQATIERLIADSFTQDQATRGSTSAAGGSGGNNANQGGAQPVCECTYSSFMKCNPATFKEVEGAVELCHLFEKT